VYRRGFNSDRGARIASERPDRAIAATARAATEQPTKTLTVPRPVDRALATQTSEETIGGSDRLVDALVVWGDEATIAARVQEHRDAGADHVCIQVLTDDPRAFPADQWRALAPSRTF
jgi:hypothetical protein